MKAVRRPMPQVFTTPKPREPTLVVAMQPWELHAIEAVRERLARAGRWDCTDRIDGMSNAELHVLADHEGCQFHPVLWTASAEVVDIATRRPQGVAARTSARYNESGRRVALTTAGPARTCCGGPDVPDVTDAAHGALAPLSSEGA